jgi:cell wall-associated NlpC family hydrolase
MPAQNPPGVAGPPPVTGNPSYVYPTSTAPAQTPPGQQAVSMALTAIGTPYAWGGNGPPGPNGGFDCSGLIQWAWANGPKVTINKPVASMWNGDGLTTVWDILDPPVSGGSIVYPNAIGWIATATTPQTTLQEGDLLIWYPTSGGSSSDGHVRMYAGNNEYVAAEGNATQLNPMYSAMWTEVDGINHNSGFRGVRRYTGSGGGTGNNTGTGTGNNNANSGPTTQTGPDPDSSTSLSANYSDPRDNLPLSAYFLGQQIIGGWTSDPKNPMAGRAGTQQIQFQGVSGISQTGATLVRGGMSQLPSSGTQAGGDFRLFFMMNPTTISTYNTLDMNNISNSQTSSAANNSVPLIQSSQTISFQLIFNRMYEVWQGNMLGPSQLGVRWDVRALERLLGMYDANQPNLPSQSFNATGWGNYGSIGQPYSTPVQVVFGGVNSISFQGYIAECDYTYTIFDVNMVPVECTVNVSVQRTFMNADGVSPIVNALSRQFFQQGKPVTGLSGGQIANGPSLFTGAQQGLLSQYYNGKNVGQG